MYAANACSSAYCLKYNFPGDTLAVATLDGRMLLFTESSDLSVGTVKEPSFIWSPGDDDHEPTIISMSWGLESQGMLYGCTIGKEILAFQVNRDEGDRCRIGLQFRLKNKYVPLNVAVWPVESEILLAVGFSDGSLCFYNRKLELLNNLIGHTQSVNSLSWQHKLLELNQNKWVVANFEQQLLKNKNDRFERFQMPMLASVGSDGALKIWKVERNPDKIKSVEKNQTKKPTHYNEQFEGDISWPILKINSIDSSACLGVQELHRQRSESNQYIFSCLTEDLERHRKSTIRCVHWRPSLGDNSTRIVTGDQEGVVIVWLITRPTQGPNKQSSKPILQQSCLFQLHCPVYHCEYSPLGNSIAIGYVRSSGDRILKKGQISNDSKKDQYGKNISSKKINGSSQWETELKLSQAKSMLLRQPSGTVEVKIMAEVDGKLSEVIDGKIKRK